MDAQALSLTLRLAFCTSALLLLVGIPLAWWISKPSCSAGWARPLVQALVALPLVLPPTVIGYYLLVGLSPDSGTGSVLAKLFGHPLAFSFAGLLAGSLVYSLPFAVQPLVAGFRGVQQTYAEASAGLGVSPWQTLLRVVLPLSGSSLLTSAILTFSHTVGEFGVVLMIGGNIPGVTRTLSLVLFDQVQDFNYAAANRTAGLLLLFAMLSLLVVYSRWAEGAMARSRSLD